MGQDWLGILLTKVTKPRLSSEKSTPDSEWKKDTILKLYSKTMKWYADGSKTAERTRDQELDISKLRVVLKDLPDENSR